MRPCRCQMKSSRTLSHGVDAVGIVSLGPPRHGAAFADWLAAGYDGEMAYLAARATERLDLTVWLPDARSLILLAANYNPGAPPPAWHDPAHGRIARYAWTADYHDVLKSRLYALDVVIREARGGQRWVRHVWTLRYCSSATSPSRPVWVSSGATPAL